MIGTIQGFIFIPAEIKTHDDPTFPYGVGGQENGSLYTAVVSPFKNTGNVNQTLTIVGIQNLVNCSLSGTAEIFRGGVGLGSFAVIGINELVEIRVPLQLDLCDPVPGGGTEPFSFELNYGWS
jgi:hypothetical protein